MPAGPLPHAPAESLDAFVGAGSPEPDAAPFWLLCMHRDRVSGRQVLSARQKRAAARLEALWLEDLVQRAGPALITWAKRVPPAPLLQDWQSLATALSASAGFAAPRVVHQPNLKGGRGQFLLRVEGNLLQLAPHAQGTRAAWCATVAHETFHHFQHELIANLYRGLPLAAPLDQLAAYYRDALASYRPVGPDCLPEVHRLQPLERGAWAYGEAVARHLEKSLSNP